MTNIGNDIVDLQLAEKQSNWQRKGFLEKQFTINEQIEIQNSENPFLKVWQFWSMKEASYKCYAQKVEKRFFSPQKFECSLNQDNEGVVTFEEHNFFSTTFFSTFYIYTIAKENQEEIKIFSSICSSKMVDRELKSKLSEETGKPFEEIKKRKTLIGAPLYYHKKKLLTNSCTISHHGNYAAFAFTLKDEY